MSVLTAPAPPAPASKPPAGSPTPFRWTREQYYRLAEQGHFQGKRVMLIRGEILDMGSQNDPHARGLMFVLYVLQAAFGPGYTVRPQMPLDLGADSEPEPDLAVVPGNYRSQPLGHPTSALLVVEVSDTTLQFDITTKAELYATAGIADYWVVDVTNRRLLVFRDPAPLPGPLGATAYRTCLTLAPADTVAPLAAPNNPVAVADLLP